MTGVMRGYGEARDEPGDKRKRDQEAAHGSVGTHV
jgi:hypothetical protein